jgi:hypothetical protein
MERRAWRIEVLVVRVLTFVLDANASTFWKCFGVVEASRRGLRSSG